MNEKQIVDKWLSVFAGGVDPEDMQKRVYSHGNHMWHIFSWELVDCLKEDDARKAFDELEYENAIRFTWGYSEQDNYPHIENITNISKITAEALNNEADVYIVGENFDWTYVHTHEIHCGPYFLKK